MSIRTLNAVLIFLLAFCLGISLPAWAQSTSTGTVTGSVTDPTGAVVADATVTLTDIETNVAHSMTTNASGFRHPEKCQGDRGG
jgi:type 1 fimbria pilin